MSQPPRDPPPLLRSLGFTPDASRGLSSALRGRVGWREGHGLWRRTEPGLHLLSCNFTKLNEATLPYLVVTWEDESVWRMLSNRGPSRGPRRSIHCTGTAPEPGWKLAVQAARPGGRREARRAGRSAGAVWGRQQGEPRAEERGLGHGGVRAQGCPWRPNCPHSTLLSQGRIRADVILLGHRG